MIADINFEMDEATPLGLIALLAHLDTSTSIMDDMMCVLMDTTMTTIHILDNNVMNHAPNALAHQQLNVQNEIAPCSINWLMIINDH